MIHVCKSDELDGVLCDIPLNIAQLTAENEPHNIV